MADSYKIPPELANIAKQALANYGIADTTISAPSGGNNFVSRIELGKDSYALRIHRRGYRKQHFIEAEMTYLACLCKQGTVSVPQPIRNQHGDLVTVIQTVKNRYCCTLLTWLSGKQKRPGKGLGSASLIRIGRALGKIHNFSEDFDIPAGIEFPLLTKTGSLLDRQNGVEYLNTDGQLLVETAVGQIIPALRALHEKVGHVGIVHGDFILKNILHHGRTTHVIDFDDCGVSNFLHDFSGILENLYDYPNSNRLISYFLSGYREVRPLNSAIEHHIDTLVTLRHLDGLAWIIGKWRDQEISDSFYRKVLKYRLDSIESTRAKSL